MNRYGRAPWGDRFPASRVPSYSSHRKPLTTDAVIVGGGLTGAAAAYAFASAGINVVLLEADRIGRGATSLAAGWISDDPGVPFAEAENLLGLRVARGGFQAWRRAAVEFATLIRRLNIKCYLEPRTSLTIALTPEQQDAFVHSAPKVFRPVKGGWGRRGATNVRLAAATERTLRPALETAWNNKAQSRPARRPRPSRRAGS